ncbi:MAG: hypothetical protein HDT27_01720 [Subdoligranulum sp.]|nr:hypothetical protein [Subdoligranulum sp.]
MRQTKRLEHFDTYKLPELDQKTYSPRQSRSNLTKSRILVNKLRLFLTKLRISAYPATSKLDQKTYFVNQIPSKPDQNTSFGRANYV